jgi:hypothetical protein
MKIKAIKKIKNISWSPKDFAKHSETIGKMKKRFKSKTNIKLRRKGKINLKRKGMKKAMLVRSK